MGRGGGVGKAGDNPYHKVPCNLTSSNVLNENDGFFGLMDKAVVSGVRCLEFKSHLATKHFFLS